MGERRRAGARQGGSLGAQRHRGLLRMQVRYGLMRPAREFWSVLQRLQRRYGGAGLALSCGRRAAAAVHADLARFEDPA